MGSINRGLDQPSEESFLIAAVQEQTLILSNISNINR